MSNTGSVLKTLEKMMVVEVMVMVMKVMMVVMILLRSCLKLPALKHYSCSFFFWVAAATAAAATGA